MEIYQVFWEKKIVLGHLYMVFLKYSQTRLLVITKR